jgi:hypothetical protein
MNSKEQKIYDLVRAELTDDLVPEEYRGKVDSPYCGHCHHATIAMYNLLDGKDNDYKVRKAIDELGLKHYWLETASGEIIDPTVEQYTDLGRSTPYANRVTKGISYRKTKATITIIKNVKKKIG